ncbi:MAG: GNAT family N-acetyltransferase [Armatimonadetes bacterium]|nr:GNAT family N-acetyltransferase [Armatimonadota bacterium]
MPVTITYLEQTSPDDLRPKELADPRLTVVEALAPQWRFNHFLYCLVGHDWQWFDRLKWSDDEWAAFAESPDLRTLVGYYDGSPAGYIELRRQGDEVEIASFGLAPRFVGLGLGGAFLTLAVRAAWAWEARRVWLHTCTLDHPRALPNYLARGFRVVRTVTE